MDPKMLEIYANMLNESTDKSTAKVEGKGAAVKGGELEGAKDKAKIDPNANVTIKKPVEGKSSDIKGAEPQKLIKKEAKEEATLGASFEALYNKTINEEEEVENEVGVEPVSDVESKDFSEDSGDFNTDEEITEDEEIDIVSELRLMADRLNELAEKMGLGEEDVTLDVEEPTIDDETISVPKDDEIVKTEAIKHEPTPKPLKKSSFGPKMSKTISKIKTANGKAGQMKKQAFDGKPETLKKSEFGPTMSKTVKGSGPAVTGGNFI